MHTNVTKAEPIKHFNSVDSVNYFIKPSFENTENLFYIKIDLEQLKKLSKCIEVLQNL